MYESLKKKRGNKWAAKIHRTRGLVEQEYVSLLLLLLLFC